MQTVLIVVHLLIVVALVVVVLLQRSEGGALGMGGGGGFMTGRGQANVLTRATAILAALFFATSLGLTLLARYGHGNQLNFNVPAGPAEKAPALPSSKGQGSVLDQVRAIEQQRGTAAAGGAAPAAAPAPTATPGAPALEPHRDAGRAERHARTQEPSGARRSGKPGTGDAPGLVAAVDGAAAAPQQGVDGMARLALALPKSGESR